MKTKDIVKEASDAIRRMKTEDWIGENCKIRGFNKGNEIEGKFLWYDKVAEIAYFIQIIESDGVPSPDKSYIVAVWKGNNMTFTYKLGEILK